MFRTRFAVAIGLVIGMAALEGICAGRGVRQFFSTVRFPPYSPALWVWSLIGGGYYLVFGFLLFRLPSLPASRLRAATFALVVAMMLGNALSNIVIFRRRNLRASNVIGWIYAALDGTLAICMWQLDRGAAVVLLPYLLYRIYAVWWGHAIMKLNPRVTV